jgi:hypothetical protein
VRRRDDATSHHEHPSRVRARDAVVLEPFTTFDHENEHAPTSAAFVVWQTGPSMWAVLDGDSCLVVARKRTRHDAHAAAWKFAGARRRAMRRTRAALP